MFRAIRRQINPATVMAFVALIFAMTGGAFAVTDHGGNGYGAQATASKSKAKPKGKPGPRGPAGPKGETGAAGPKGETGAAGSAGPKGETGAAGSAGLKGEAGTAGANGTNGESVTSTTLNEGEEGCNAGGSKFTVDGKATTACNGEKGEPGETGFTKHLPGGDTETGVYGTVFSGSQGVEAAILPISLPIPLLVPIQGSKVFVVSGEEQDHLNGEQPPTECQGTLQAPTAGKGAFCVYEGKGNLPEGASLHLNGNVVGTSGLTVVAIYNLNGGGEESATVYGAWAVTAP
jgi:hypothetical protein